VERPLDFFQQVGDVVEGEPRANTPEIAGLDAKRPFTGSLARFVQGAAKRAVHRLLEGAARAPRFAL